jgi:hypothetical protein
MLGMVRREVAFSRQKGRDAKSQIEQLLYGPGSGD